MVVHQKNVDGIIIITLRGKIFGDTETCQLHGVISAAVDQGNVKILLDLKEIEWMGSVGFGCITSGLLLARQKGGDLRLCCLNQKVQRLLKITKLDSVFQTYTTVNHGLSSFLKHVDIGTRKKAGPAAGFKTV